MTLWLTRTLCVLALFAYLCPLAVNAQVAEDRVAFIIGNGGYPKSLALKNPLNDATAIEKQLSGLGFETKSYKDLKVAEVAGLRQQMESRLKRNSVLFFYYAGHGVQIDGRNYLLPVDATLNDGDKASQESLYLGDVLHAIERMRPKIAVVILDACRDNPFKDQKNSAGAKQGLARVDPPTSTVVFYATRPGGTAQDGDQDNGVFTQALLQEMVKPEQPLEVVFRRVSTSVFKSTKSEQEPWIEGVIREEFVINQANLLKPAPPELVAVAKPSALPSPQVEKEPALPLVILPEPPVELQVAVNASFDDAIQKIRSIKDKINLENEPTHFACNGDICESYQSWIKKFNDGATQEIIKKANSKITSNSFLKVCEYDLEKKSCKGEDVRFPFYGTNLILTNTFFIEGFGIENAQTNKSGGVSFSAKVKGGSVWYFGNKFPVACGQADSKISYERDKLNFEIVRSVCIALTVSTNKSKINVLLFDYLNNEYIAELDIGMVGLGVAGGGKKIVKFFF
jgi:hypothetical protein